MGRRYWEWEPAFEVVPHRAALAVVDMQNGFVDEGAPLEVPMAAEQVPTIRKAVGACREHGLPVAFTKFCVDEDFHYDFYWRIADQRGLQLGGEERMFAPETYEAQVVEGLTPTHDEPIFKKCGYDAFAGTDLDGWLEEHGRDQLVVCGTVVNWCVDSTVRAAFHRDLKVIVLADAVSGYEHGGLSGQQWVDAELDLFAEAFGRVMTTEELLSELTKR